MARMTIRTDREFCDWVRLRQEATEGAGMVDQRLIEATDRLAAAADKGQRLREALIEMYDAGAAMMRVIALGGLVGELETELRASGVRDGFGARANAALAGEEAHR